VRPGTTIVMAILLAGLLIAGTLQFFLLAR
jgi:hypothetical protein